MAPRRRTERRSVTLKEVAERAGVHASTVSRALNPATRSMVVEAVVERVMKAAADLGYRPDPVAASLRTGRSKLIGILLPDIANTVFAPILSGASERLSSQGYSVLVAYCIAQGIPTVLVNRAETRARLSAVISDDASGMQLAVDHLVELGHKAI